MKKSRKLAMASIAFAVVFACWVTGTALSGFIKTGSVEPSIEELMQKHMLPGVLRTRHIVRYDEDRLRTEILNAFPEIAEVEIDGSIVRVTDKNGNVNSYEITMSKKGGS